jgi:DNA-binding MarR family transcriptional regulator
MAVIRRALDRLRAHPPREYADDLARVAYTLWASGHAYRAQPGRMDRREQLLQTMTDGGSIDELRRVLGLSHSGGVRVVKALSRAELVELRRDPDDGRAVQVRLTEQGAAAATRIRAARLEALDTLLDGLDRAARDQLDALLAQALGAATGDRDDARHTCRLCDPGVCGHPERCPVTRAADGVAGLAE